MSKVRAAWKELSLVGTWIATVAGSFLLPLPDWAAVDEHRSYTHFILFISTVLAGFVLLLTFRLSSKKFWLGLSLCSLLLFIASFFLYNSLRESKTLPYQGTYRIIGSMTDADFVLQRSRIEQEEGFSIADKDLLEYAGGDPTILWSEKDIASNKWQLIFSLLSAYALLSVFLISFMNLVLQIKSDEKS